MCVRHPAPQILRRGARPEPDGPGSGSSVAEQATISPHQSRWSPGAGTIEAPAPDSGDPPGSGPHASGEVSRAARPRNPPASVTKRRDGGAIRERAGSTLRGQGSSGAVGRSGCASSPAIGLLGLVTGWPSTHAREAPTGRRAASDQGRLFPWSKMSAPMKPVGLIASGQ